MTEYFALFTLLWRLWLLIAQLLLLKLRYYNGGIWRLYVCTSVRPYVCTSVRLYIYTSLRLYACPMSILEKVTRPRFTKIGKDSPYKE